MVLADIGRAVVFAAGLAVVFAIAASALRTVVLPRAVPSQLARTVFLIVRVGFQLRLGRAPDYERRDRVMAMYGPIALFTLLATWLLAVWAAFGAMCWAAGSLSAWRAFTLSGSSLFTLGFITPPGAGLTLLAFTEAAVGLGLVALLITYLPSLYAGFSRREALVTKLEVRAGSPPTGRELLIRAWVLERFDLLTELWQDWENWFIEVEETHTSFPALSFFRSPQPDHSWVTAAGAILDAASLYNAAIAAQRDIDADLCIRAGYLMLRRVGAFFRLPYPADPAPDQPISVSREEYDAVLDELAEAGVPLHADRDQAWRDFAGWRVNYDEVLVRLAALTVAPYAPWSSDRSMAGAAPRLLRWVLPF